MYDSIDEFDAPDTEVKPEIDRRRLLLGLSVVLGLVVLVGVAFFSVGYGVDDAIDREGIEAERKAYTAALTEPFPALRRARLTDFENVYPNSRRARAVKAQLEILNQAEATDWSVLTNIIFATEKSPDEKLEALNSYEAVWSGAMLGGRGEQLFKIRNNIEYERDDLPERDLPVNSDDALDADIMAGADQSSSDIFIASSGDSNIRPSIQTEDIIVLPQLRRNVKPRYPSRALDRGAEAIIVLRLYIDDRGRVDETELIMSEAGRYENDFIRAAERAARRTRFHPKTINGQPVFDHDGIVKRYRFQIDN